MAKTKKQLKSTAHKYAGHSDGLFALKLAMYVILGSLWIKVTNEGSDIRIPIGLIIGIIFTSHEHFQIDRKIEYAVLLLAALIGYWAPMGLYIAF
jgi:hypothetical protein